MDQNSLMGSRLGLLKQVDVLTATHCKGCTISDVKRGLASCKKAECTTLDKFGEIGHLLDVNLNELRLLRNNVQAPPIVKKESEVLVLAKHKLTVEKYNDYKAQGKTDKEIMALEDLHSVGLNQFKRENDLIGKHKRGPATKPTPAQKHKAESTLREKSVVTPSVDFERISILEKELADIKAKLKDALTFNESLKIENATLNEQVWGSRLQALYAKQAELENFIAEKHGLDVLDYLEEQQLAILVELAESANEWQGFKYWKQNKAIDREKILEETVDVLHLILARGLALGWQIVGIQTVKTNSLTKQYTTLMQTIAPLEESKETYAYAFNTYVGLVEMLGFTWSEVEVAYAKKHQENIDRQNNNY